METRGKTRGSGVTRLRASHSVRHGRTSLSGCTSASPGKVRHRRHTSGRLVALFVFLVALFWESRPLLPEEIPAKRLANTIASLGFAVVSASLFPSDVERAQPGTLLGTERSGASKRAPFSSDRISQGQQLSSSTRAKHAAGGFPAAGPMLRLHGDEGSTAKAPSASLKSLPQQGQRSASGRREEVMTASRNRSAVDLSLKTRRQRGEAAPEVEKQKRAFSSLQAAFTQLSREP